MTVGIISLMSGVYIPQSLRFYSCRALEKGGLHTLALAKLFEILPESTLSKFPVSSLLGKAMSHGENDAPSLNGLKVVLSHVEDLSVTRALVEQYVDQLCNENSETVKGMLDFESLPLFSSWQFKHVIASVSNAKYSYSILAYCDNRGVIMN